MFRFRLFDIPFEVAPYFWIISAVLGGNAAHGPNAVLLLAVWVACVFVSIVIHELGHALMARHYGALPRVEMYALGGLTRLPGARFTRVQDLMVVLGGPAAGLALYLAVREGIRYLLTSVPAAQEFLVPGAPGDFVARHAVELMANYPALPLGNGVDPANIAAGNALSNLLYINLAWTLFNLLPILPLDGGLILRNLLGFDRIGLARIIGMVCAAGCAVWAGLSGWIYGAFFFGMLAFQNSRGGGTLPGPAGR